jgi:two-component system NtrC family sensor kinase
VPSDRTAADDAGDDLTRRQRDLDEAREQLLATGQILTAIGTSASDLEAVLGTVVESASRLCRADSAQI